MPGPTQDHAELEVDHVLISAFAATLVRDHVHMTPARRGGGGVQELPNFADKQY